MLASSFPAKILLLGEYTILNGSKALAFPYDDLSGEWSFEDDGSELREHSRKSLKSFVEKSGADAIHMSKLAQDFNEGIWFKSSIPQGFGLGSSGAVIAGIFDRYGKGSDDLLSDKFALARLEDFFHGSSSGLDPLVSHIQKTLLIHTADKVEVLEERPVLSGFFLLNTGKPRNTGPLVSIYKEKLKDPQFKKSCADILTREVNFAIESVINGDQTNLFHHLWHISKFQWEFFPEMIPTKERDLWARGLESGEYILKLCGAGGGGYLLGYSHRLNIEELRRAMPQHELRELT